jgi:predicted dienelactone hydrolase
MRAATIAALAAAVVVAAIGARPRATLAAESCGRPFSVGYRVVQVDKLNVGVWYPTSGAETDFTYAKGVKGRALKDGPVERCTRAPLVVFSHGLTGCGTQVVYFTEALARSGYIVAAPDHADALCSVTGKGALHTIKTDESFFTPDKWTDRTYIDRRDDVERTIASMRASPDFAPALAAGAVGMVGHSLGGYDALALAGGWDSWKDDRIGAVVAMSPYLTPFVVKHRLGDIHVPVMYQGAQWDVGITPSLRGERGAFALSNRPKYYVELKAGGHFEWTNLPCGANPVSRCLDSKANPRLINAYAIAFLDRYLKGDAEALTRLDGKGLAAYQQQP